MVYDNTLNFRVHEISWILWQSEILACYGLTAGIRCQVVGKIQEKYFYKIETNLLFLQGFYSYVNIAAPFALGSWSAWRHCHFPSCVQRYLFLGYLFLGYLFQSYLFLGYLFLGYLFRGYLFLGYLFSGVFIPGVFIPSYLFLGCLFRGIYS